jgi:hypothetical protein
MNPEGIHEAESHRTIRMNDCRDENFRPNPDRNQAAGCSDMVSPVVNKFPVWDAGAAELQKPDDHRASPSDVGRNLNRGCGIRHQ